MRLATFVPRRTVRLGRPRPGGPHRRGMLLAGMWCQAAVANIRGLAGLGSHGRGGASAGFGSFSHGGHSDGRTGWQAAFLGDSALRAEKELVEVAGQGCRGIRDRAIEDLGPLQSAAIDQAVGSFSSVISAVVAPLRRRPIVLRPTTNPLAPSIVTNGGTSLISVPGRRPSPCARRGRTDGWRRRRR